MTKSKEAPRKPTRYYTPTFGGLINSGTTTLRAQIILGFTPSMDCLRVMDEVAQATPGTSGVFTEGRRSPIVLVFTTKVRKGQTAERFEAWKKTFLAVVAAASNKDLANFEQQTHDVNDYRGDLVYQDQVMRRDR